MSNVPMTLPELVISTQTHPFAATSSFVELDDGRIFHASKAVCNYSEDGGQSWSEVRWMKDVEGKPVQGASLVKLPGKNEIGLMGCLSSKEADQLFPAPKTSYATRKYRNFLCYWRSADGGETWQRPILVTPPDEPVWCMTDTLVRLSSGRIIVPVFSCIGQPVGPGDRTPPGAGRLIANQFTAVGGHHTDPRFSYAFVVYSDDEGRTWQRNDDDELFILMDWNALYSYINEGSIAEYAPGKLMAVFRTGLGRLFQAWSENYGQTWTRPQPSPLASSTSTPALRRLPNGHLLAVWDQDSEEEIKAGLIYQRLSSAVSRNGGTVWEFFQNVESNSEITRVEPGPVRPTRPDYLIARPGQPAFEHDPRYVVEADSRIHVKSPSILVMKDRVLIAYTHHECEPDAVEACLNTCGQGGYRQPENGKYIRQTLKILPLKWFYGGKEPADNPFLKKAYEPAKP